MIRKVIQLVLKWVWVKIRGGGVWNQTSIGEGSAWSCKKRARKCALALQFECLMSKAGREGCSESQWALLHSALWPSVYIPPTLTHCHPGIVYTHTNTLTPWNNLHTHKHLWIVYTHCRLGIHIDIVNKKRAISVFSFQTTHVRNRVPWEITIVQPPLHFVSKSTLLH